jgi:hypothetical protein
VLPLARGAKVALLGSACHAGFFAAQWPWDAGDYYMIGGSGAVKSGSDDQWTILRGLQAGASAGEIGSLIRMIASLIRMIASLIRMIASLIRCERGRDWVAPRRR